MSGREPRRPQRPHRATAAAPGRTRRRAGGPSRSDLRARYRRAARLVFLVPAGLYVLFAFVVPVIYNLILSFEVTTPATIASLFAPWAGLSNYKMTLLNSITQSALIRTLTFTVLSLLFQFLIGFGLALLFNLRFPLNKLARSLVIVPWLLPFLVTGFIFRFLFQLEAGAVNQVLLDVHLIHAPIGYLLSPGWAYVTVLITNIWLGVPFFTVLLFSALQDVPPELKEAAMIDGAGPWQTLVRVTLPVIRPVIEVTFVLGFVFTVKVFDIVISLTQGGPANSHPADRHLGVQPVLPAVRLRRRSRPQHGAAHHRPAGRADLHQAQPRFTEAGLTWAGNGNSRRGWPESPRWSRWRSCCSRSTRSSSARSRPTPSCSARTTTSSRPPRRWPTTGTSSRPRAATSCRSLIIGVATAILTLAIALPAAHALARYRFRVTVAVVASLLVAQILPSIVIANSLFVVYHKLHLLNSYPGLILADASYAVPFSILVMRAFMLGLPTDVLQAARVDGATEWGTFVRIVLPMSRSAIITVALFAFLNGWGDFIFALTLLNGSTLQPITLSIYNYIGVFSQNLGAAMALAVFAILPAAMMLIAAQRYIAAGLTVGSVKG